MDSGFILVYWFVYGLSMVLRRPAQWLRYSMVWKP